MANQNEGNFARSQVTSKVKTSKLREAQENGSDHFGRAFAFLRGRREFSRPIPWRGERSFTQ